MILTWIIIFIGMEFPHIAFIGLPDNIFISIFGDPQNIIVIIGFDNLLNFLPLIRTHIR